MANSVFLCQKQWEFKNNFIQWITYLKTNILAIWKQQNCLYVLKIYRQYLLKENRKLIIFDFLIFTNLFQFFSYNLLLQPRSQSQNSSEYIIFQMSINSTIHMLQTITPQTDSVKIFTILKPFSELYKSNQVIGEIYLYTSDMTYHGVIFDENRNKEISWNQKTFDLIVDSVSGKRQNTVINFFRHDENKMQSYDSKKANMLNLMCEIEGGLKLLMFEIKLKEYSEQPPLVHMRFLFDEMKKQIEESEAKLISECQYFQTQIKQIDAIGRQVSDQHHFQLQLMKNAFLPLINDVKGKIKRKINEAGGGSNNNMLFEEEQQRQATQSLAKNSAMNRKILKVDRQSMEQQPPEKNATSVNDELLSLFN